MNARVVSNRFLILCIVSTCSATAATPERPNVVMIMTDNHGAWTLGCYGNKDIRTPNIDRLAEEGTLFENAFASNPVCSPTRASVLTGLIPSQHGVHCFLRGGRLQTGPDARCTLDEFRSMPEILKDNGYRCGLVGKWHLGGNMTPQEGFDDYWITMPHGGTSTFYDAQIIEDGKLRKEPEYLTDFWTKHALKFLKQSEEADDQPFFLFLSYNGPYSLSRLLLREGQNRHAEYYRDKELPSFPRETPHPWQLHNRDYQNNPVSIRRVATEVSGVDDGVGTVMQTLEELGEDDNTIVIFLADQGWVGGHGGFFGMGDHTQPVTAVDGMMKIPMIWRQPNKIASGLRSEKLVANYDVLPTLLQAVGIDEEVKASPGNSFDTELNRKSSPADVTDDEAIFYEFETLRCIRTRRWKYTHRHPNGPHELYDLKNDPDEFENLFVADLSSHHSASDERRGDDDGKQKTSAGSETPDKRITDGEDHRSTTPAPAQPLHTEHDGYVAIQQQLKQRLDNFYTKHAAPKYDLWNGGGSQTVIYDGIEEEVAQVEATPPPQLPEDFEPQQFTLPDGFTAELVAGPPLVTHPTMGCFDDRGRFFVCNNAGVNMSAQELEKNLPNEIRMLEDRDGDGQFDKSTVFANKMTFPMGATWHDGALYVASPPNIWRLEDTDGDGVADKRDVIVGKFGYTGNAASIHGCFFSPDGRLYWCDGFHGHEFENDDGIVVSKRKGSYIFSCKPDGSDICIHSGGGMDNPVEVDFTDTGDVIGTVNIMYTRPRVDCLVHWQYGGAYPHRESFLDEWPITGELLGPIHRFGHVAVSGTTRYRSGVMNHEWRDDFFVTFFNLGRVVRMELTPDGSTYTATQREFLSCSNRDFHPTDLIEDADGSLLVVDTGGWFYRGCPTSQIARPDVLGGIYRIRRNGMTTVSDPRGLRTDWTQRSNSRLMRDLKDTRFAVREKVIQECVRRGESVVDDLARTAKSADIVARKNALWALTRIIQRSNREPQIVPRGVLSFGSWRDEPALTEAARKATSQKTVEDGRDKDSSKRKPAGPHQSESDAYIAKARAAIRSAFEDRDAAVRQIACHALWVNPDKEAVGDLSKRIIDPSPGVRRMAWTAIGELRDSDVTGWSYVGTKSWPGTTRTVEFERDREERHARSFAALRIGGSAQPYSLPKIANDSRQMLFEDPEDLIVLEQRFRSGISIPLLQDCLNQGTQDVVNMVSYIMRRRKQQKTITLDQERMLETSAAERLRAELSLEDSFDPETLTGLLTAFRSSPTATQVVAARLLGDSITADQKKALLRLLVNARPVAHESLTSVLSHLMSSEDVEERLLTLQAAGHCGTKSFLPQLERMAFGDDESQAIRLAALKAALQIRGQCDNRTFEHAMHLITTGTIVERQAGFDVLTGFPMPTDRLSMIAELFEDAGPQELQRLIVLFQRSLGAEPAADFLEHLETARSLNSLPMREVSEVVKRFPSELHERANAILDRLQQAENQKLRKLDSLVGQLSSGNTTSGHEAFFSEKAKCATCHVIGDKGKRVGPDLTTIGANRSEKDLLESILFPSSTIVRQYEPWSVVTTSGKTHNGLIVRDATDEITIQQSSGQRVTISRSDIEELVQSTVSLMPKGLDEQLRPQQIVDIVAFLKQQTSASPSSSSPAQ